MGSGGYSAGRSGSSSMKSSSDTISTSESSILMETGRPRATATDRSRVKSVHQMRFQSRLSALLSCEPSMLLFVSSLRPNTSMPVPTSCACPSLEQRSLQLYSSKKRFWSHLAQRQSRPLEDFRAHSGAYLMNLSVTFSVRYYKYFQAARRRSMVCCCKCLKDAT